MNNSNETFSKKWRLKKRGEIEHLFTNGRSIYTASFKIVVTPNGSSHNRAMVAVPKKRFKKAVDRNYIKRLVRESLRRSPSFKEVFVGYNIAFIYGANSIPTLESVQKEVEYGLEKCIERDQKSVNSSAATID